MPRAKVFGFGIIALLAISLIPALTVYAKRSEEDRAEKFIEIAQKAYREATKLANKTEAAGGDVTLAETLISEGQGLLDQANDNYTDGNYALASEKAKAAQEKFRDAIEALDFEEDEEGAGHGILVAIEQAMERLRRLNGTINGLEINPEDETYLNWAKGNVTEAKNDLLDAKAIIEGKPTNASEAARLLGRANRNIEEAYKALKLIGDHNMTGRAESFLTGLKKQLQKTEDEIAEGDEEEQATIDDIQQLIDGAKDDLLNGDKKDALEKTKDARDLLHDLTKELKKPEHGKP